MAGLQEARAAMVEDLATRLPEFRWLGVGRDDGAAAGEFNPIFYRAERWRAVRHGTFWLGAVVDLPAKGWDAHCRRIVTWAEFSRADGGGAAWFHFNTHFDHLGREARRQSAHLLRAQADQLAGGAPTLVTGDFNGPERSAAFAILTDGDDGFRDTRLLAAGPSGPRKTWRGLFLTGLGANRLDFILARGVNAVMAHRVVRDSPWWRAASDHFPVVADFADS